MMFVAKATMKDFIFWKLYSTQSISIVKLSFIAILLEFKGN